MYADDERGRLARVPSAGTVAAGDTPPRDSLDVLSALASRHALSAIDAARGHLNFLVLALVVYHHAYLHAAA